MAPRLRTIPSSKPSARLMADQAHAKLRRAVAFHRKGQLAQAKSVYVDILKGQPNHFDALHLLGVVALQTGHFQDSVRLIGRAIAISPKTAEFYYNRGNALSGLKQYSSALEDYDGAIRLKPDNAVAFSNRGIALTELKRFDEALESFDRAIGLKPDYAEAHSNRGIALQQVERFDAAVESFDRAIAIMPNYAEAYSNRGMALKELRQFDAAVESYNKAIAIKPEYAEAYSNRGNALQQLKQIEDAVASYDRAIAIKPNYAEAHWNKSFASLVSGDLATGWELYEWRWKTERFKLSSQTYSGAQWRGGEESRGKTILLHSEQGLGDTIQFCRYAPLVSGLGADVVLTVPKALAGLLETLSGVSELIVEGEEVPKYDYQCPLLSLPLAFKTTLESIPQSMHYLSADQDKVEYWKSKLGEKTAPRIGLVWSGKIRQNKDRSRSIPLDTFIKYLPPGFQYVCLQKEFYDIDLPVLETQDNIYCPGDSLNDFTDTAALCDLMDIVVSIDTGVAHLSAALGRETCILLQYVPDWRWLLDREDCPWYPSATLYRQSRIGDWDSVLENVRAKLERIRT